MHRQVHKNIDLIPADLDSELIVALADGAAPDIGTALKTGGYGVGTHHVGVANDLEVLVVVMGEQWDGEERLAMIPKIRGHVADLEAASGIAIIGVGPDAILQRLGVLTVPAAKLFGDGPSVVTPMIWENENKVAVGAGVAGPQCDGLAIGGDGLIELAFGYQSIAEITVGFRQAGIEFDGPATTGDGLVKLASVFQDGAKIAIGIRQIGIRLDGLPIGGDGFIESVLALQGITEIAIGLRRIGIKGNGLSTGGDGLVQLPFGRQGDAKIIVGFEKVWIEGDGLSSGGDRRIEVAHFRQDVGEIAVRLGGVWVKSNGPAYQIHRDVIASRLMRDHSQKMDCIGMRRLLGEDLPVEPLGLLQLPGLMVPHRQFEGLLDGELGHERPSPLLPCLISRRLGFFFSNLSDAHDSEIN